MRGKSWSTRGCVVVLVAVALAMVGVAAGAQTGGPVDPGAVERMKWIETTVAINGQVLLQARMDVKGGAGILASRPAEAGALGPGVRFVIANVQFFEWATPDTSPVEITSFEGGPASIRLPYLAGGARYPYVRVDYQQGPERKSLWVRIDGKVRRTLGELTGNKDDKGVVLDCALDAPKDSPYVVITIFRWPAGDPLIAWGD